MISLLTNPQIYDIMNTKIQGEIYDHRDLSDCGKTL